jgi:hypothetical protein
MRQGDLPIADDVHARMESFADVLTFAGEAFKIKNVNIVAAPEWEYDLFHERDSNPQGK